MIYGIGDLHLDYTGSKPMGIFGDQWIDHEEKIFSTWKRIVKEDDLVLLPGDISWALKLEGAYQDLMRIDELPGRKIITKGNHDFWWQGPKKLRELDLKTIDFIQNNSYTYGNIGIGGSRGWSSRDSDGFDQQDEKIFKRELNRLDLSLSSLKGVEARIAMLHYPPFNTDLSPNDFFDVMGQYGVNICIYGHLHGIGHRLAVEGEIKGIQCYCVSSDYIDFRPKIIL